MAEAPAQTSAANQIRAIWEAGRQAVLGWLQIPSPLAAEALATCGYDGLVIDLQHSPTDFSTAVAMMTAIEGRGIEPFVRVQANDAGDIGKLLDVGAYGIIAPMIETAGQAQDLADALHYPPRGRRSFGPRRPMLRYGTAYHTLASASIVSFAMIETRRGLDALDAILAVDGIDGVFIGPADLAFALGCEPKPDSDAPPVVGAVRRIREQAHDAGKRVGIFCGSPQFARAKLDEGFDLVTLTPDLAMLTTAARNSLQSLRSG